MATCVPIPPRREKKAHPKKNPALSFRAGCATVRAQGLLNREEFAAIIDLVAGQTGQSYTVEHVDKCFLQADVDGSGLIDLNELLLYRQHAAGRGPRRRARLP